MVFHDSALRRITKARPVEKGELMETIGEKKFAKYGDLISELLERHKVVAAG